MSDNNNSLTTEDVRKVADLAMLNLTDEQVEQYTPQLGSILSLVAEMDSVDIEGYEPTHHPHGLVNVYRDDVIEAADVTESVMASAPDTENNQYKVPPALGEEQ